MAFDGLSFETNYVIRIEWIEHLIDTSFDRDLHCIDHPNSTYVGLAST